MPAGWPGRIAVACVAAAACGAILALWGLIGPAILLDLGAAMCL